MTFVDVVQLRSLVLLGRRLLGLDVGDKRIGLALSDVTWSVASPVRTLPGRVSPKTSKRCAHWFRSWR